MAEGISIEVHATATSEALQRLAGRISDRRVVNKELAIQMHSWVMRNFDAEGALNHAWASLSPNYAKWKAKRYGALHILELSGALRASFGDFGYDNDSATIGSPLEYAPYHEHGLPEKNLPARPMLPPTEVALQDAMDVYENYLHTSVREEKLA
jgi:phage virion morphogenesis protein